MTERGYVRFDTALNGTLEDEEAPLPANLRAAANIDTQIGTSTQAALDLKAAKGANSDITSLSGLTTPLSVGQGGTGQDTLAELKTAMAFVKADVGLGNVDNTSDASKPISTATQEALDLKQNIADMGVLNAKLYGFLPAASAAANKTALQNAMAAAIAENARLYIPEGLYNCAPDVAADDGVISVFGDGKKNTVITFTSAGTNGIAITQSDPAFTTTFKGIGFVASAAISGTGLSISYDDLTGDVANTAEVEDCSFTPSGAGYFAVDLTFSNCRHGRVVNSNFIGVYGSTTEALSFAGNTTDASILSCTFANLGKAISVVGECEGTTVIGNIGINIDYGVYKVPSTSGEPGLFMQSNHFNAIVRCVKATNLLQAEIGNNLFYSYTAVAMPGMDQIEIDGASTDTILIYGNTFHAASYTGTVRAINVSAGTRVIMQGNAFIDFDTGIVIGASASLCEIWANTFSSVTTRISDSGSNTLIMDREANGRLRLQGPGDFTHIISGATSAALLLQDLGGASNAKNIGLLADAQTILVRRYNDDFSTIADLARFANGAVSLGGTLNGEALRVNTGSFANRLEVTGTATGSSPSLSAAGSDTNINLKLTPKGSGSLQFGAHSALDAETVTGFITILDAGGATRKLAVVS